MTFLEAIEKRTSRRSYINKPIDPEKLVQIKEAIKKYNAMSGLSIQFVDDGSKAFQGFRKSYGMFSGVRSFIALIGKTADPDLLEKAGYYGEMLALEATTLGLGTCFVGGTYDKESCPCTVNDDETLICVITIGNVEQAHALKERIIYRMTHLSRVQMEKLYEADQEVPSWFLDGMRAVQLAPSTMNRHPVKIVYKSGKASAYVDSPQGSNLIDLGIAKANFGIAAGGRFEFGNHGVFTKT